MAPTLVPSGRSHPTSAAAATVVAVSDEFAPATDEEARRVASRLPGSTLLAGARPRSSGSHVRSSEPTWSTSHVTASTGPTNPLFSRLRLHDRWMTSAEIVQLDLRGALVVLSACESGVHGRAAEPVGLGWAFLAAGAAGVLVSSWPVDDEATMVVMDSLYSWLAAGTPPDEALRRAQQHAADLQPHPYYWGAFGYLVRPRHPPGGPIMKLPMKPQAAVVAVLALAGSALSGPASAGAPDQPTPMEVAGIDIVVKMDGDPAYSAAISPATTRSR